MDIDEVNRELAGVAGNLTGHVGSDSVTPDGEVPDIVNNAEMMKALAREYDGLYIRRGHLGDPRAYWAEAGLSPNRASACGPTWHEAVGRAIVEYLAISGAIERRGEKDRRTWETGNVAYPLVDSDEISVTEDRRVEPDRRVSNIEATWSVDPSSEENSG